MYSMQCYSCHTLKQKPMDLTSFDHHQTSIMMKNDGKSKPLSTIKDEDANTSSSSSGKAMTSQKQRGNPTCVSTEAVKKFSKNTATFTIFQPEPHDMTAALPTITLTDPEGRHIALWPVQLKKPYRHNSYPFPDLGLMTEQDRAILRDSLPSPYRPPSSEPWHSIIKKISERFLKKKTPPQHCPWTAILEQPRHRLVNSFSISTWHILFSKIKTPEHQCQTTSKPPLQFVSQAPLDTSPGRLPHHTTPALCTLEHLHHGSLTTSPFRPCPDDLPQNPLQSCHWDPPLYPLLIFL